MMELDDLKSIWKKHGSGLPHKGEAEISAMLNGTSKSIVQKLKRSVWFELGFTLVAGVALLFYAFTLPGGALKWTSIAIVLIFVAYTTYYIKKLILLSQFNPASGNLRTNIENLVNNMSGYLSYYKRSYTILYPVYFCLGILFRVIEKGTTSTLEVLRQPKTIAVLLAVAVLFYITSTWLVNWLLRKLYGNHLEKLKSILHDLDEKGQD
jgi:hypothetical protein